MNGMLLDTSQIHPVSDFIRNHKTYIARLKETHSPEVLTVNGRAEVVMLDAETYQNIVNKFRDMEAIADARSGLTLSRHILSTRSRSPKKI